jgi:hypothetical protein
MGGSIGTQSREAAKGYRMQFVNHKRTQKKYRHKRAQKMAFSKEG